MHQAILSSVHPNKKYFTSNELLKLRNFISKQRIYFIYLNFMARTFPKEFYDQDLSPTKRITAWNHVSVPQNSQQMKQKMFLLDFHFGALFSGQCLGSQKM